MKRPRQASTRDGPRAIASAVRERVVLRLAKLGYTPAEPDKFPVRIEKFAENLALWGATTSLTARPNDPAEIAFHVIDSLMPAVIAAGPDPGLLATAFGNDRKVLDVGSGAGFPGLILAAATPATFTLAESRRKRASFLSVIIAEMGLTNTEVDTMRQEPWRPDSTIRVKPPRLENAARQTASPVEGAGRQTPSRPEAGEFDLVTARAVGEPGSFYAIAAGALRSSGLAILYASRSQRLSLDAATAAGLSGYTRLAYTVERDGATVERVLAIWRKT